VPQRLFQSLSLSRAHSILNQLKKVANQANKSKSERNIEEEWFQKPNCVEKNSNRNFYLMNRNDGI
jgi:hypothetical protein